MVFVIAGYLLILIFQGTALIKKKYWRELVVFSVFFIISFTLSLLYTIGVNLPSPYKTIGYLIEEVWGLKY